MKKIIFSTLVTMAIISMANAQPDLIKKASGKINDTANQEFKFTNIIDLRTTPVEDQGESGTCWSYSTNSFVESEMIKAGKSPIHLSKIYTARCAYLEKAEAYIRMQGGLSWGDGGEEHDVINMYKKYGAVPEVDYTGLVNGKEINDFEPMQKVLKHILDSVVAIKGQIDPKAWKETFNKVLDDSLGIVPATFVLNGKVYTPKSFAQELVGINPDNYIEFISQTNTPYYQKAMMMSSDNWAYQWDYNVTPTDFTDIINNALQQGYTVAWAADVSEPYFSWSRGLALVPKNAPALENKENFTDDEKDTIYNYDDDKTELTVTPSLRQQGLEDNTTTDDHGMQIVGLAKDQNGKNFYIVKNSWGNSNKYNGFLYVSKAYVQYKTTSILVNKKSVPQTLLPKIKI